MTAGSGYVVLSTLDVGQCDCRCSSCSWRGTSDALRAISACDLRPGDASPAGRCPKCLQLAYPDRLVDRMRHHGEISHEVLAGLLELHGRMAAGRPARATDLELLLGRAKAVIKAVRGRARRAPGKKPDVNAKAATERAGPSPPAPVTSESA